MSDNCPFEALGFKPKKMFYIPVQDSNGIKKDKFLRVKEGGKIHNMLLSNHIDMNKSVIIED